MNPSPKKHGQFLTPPTDHTLSLRNGEDSFWQSRMTVAGRRAELPNLVSLRALARNIRAATVIDTAIAHSANVATAFTGIAARALTPTAPLETPASGSNQQGMDRSTLAAAHETGRRIHTHDGHRFIGARCRVSEAQTTVLGIPVVIDPSLPADTFVLRTYENFVAATFPNAP